MANCNKIAVSRTGHKEGAFATVAHMKKGRRWRMKIHLHVPIGVLVG